MNATSDKAAVGPLALLIGMLCCFCIGCSAGNDDDAMLDTESLLARYEQDRRRQDPLHYSEKDLGEFLVTQRHEPDIYYVRFHLFGVIPDQKLSKFDAAHTSHQERVRSAVLSTVQKSNLHQLTDPTLSWLKAELITQINRNLQARLLRDVVFTDFSLQKG